VSRPVEVPLFGWWLLVVVLVAVAAAALAHRRRRGHSWRVRSSCLTGMYASVPRWIVQPESNLLRLGLLPLLLLQ